MAKENTSYFRRSLANHTGEDGGYGRKPFDLMCGACLVQHFDMQAQAQITTLPHGRRKQGPDNSDIVMYQPPRLKALSLRAV